MIFVILSKNIFTTSQKKLRINNSFHERRSMFCRWIKCSPYLFILISMIRITGNVLNTSGLGILKWNVMNTTTKVITGFIAGASLGILTGILIAPNSGKRTREQIADKTKDLKNRMVGSYDDVKKAYNKEVEALLNSGKSGIDSLKNTLKV
jgi:gas vesicle protein